MKTNEKTAVARINEISSFVGKIKIPSDQVARFGKMLTRSQNRLIVIADQLQKSIDREAGREEHLTGRPVLQRVC